MSEDIIISKRNKFSKNIERCWELAEQSKLSDISCNRANFGSVVTLDNEIIGESSNDIIEELCSWCDEGCIRIEQDIKSRTNQEFCGADHAAIADTVNKGFKVRDTTVYVAGLNSKGERMIKNKSTYSCIICAKVMRLFGIKEVIVPTAFGDSILTISETMMSAKELRDEVRTWNESINVDYK